MGCHHTLAGKEEQCPLNHAIGMGGGRVVAMLWLGRLEGVLCSAEWHDLSGKGPYEWGAAMVTNGAPYGPWGLGSGSIRGLP